jgi:putative ABC transport system permease protein
MYGVTPGYDAAMRLQLKSGRFLAAQDDAKAPRRAVINETMAKKMWPGKDPLGLRFKLEGDRESKDPWFIVVGIVADVRQYSLDAAPPMQFYLPNAQFPGGSMVLVARTKGDPAGFIQTIRNEILAVDREQPAFNLATMDDVLGTSLALRRFSMRLLGAFAGLALLLAAVGVYGVISYTTAQRTREFGIRLALGAGPAALRTMVLRQGLSLTGLGLVIGGVLAFATTHFLRSLLFEVSPFDAVTFGSVAALLIAVTLLASYLPARRATKADPLIALRAE